VNIAQNCVTLCLHRPASAIHGLQPGSNPDERR
jgi:hypothetical protein